MLRSLFATFFILLAFSGTAQQTIEQRLEEMDLFWQQNPQEKIYIHTDRSTYTAGETIWYKSYNTIGIDNNLSILSNINYVELVDPRNTIVQQQAIATNIGLGTGSITLSDTLIEGTYRLRAYTKWMQNYDSNYFFEKNIAITNGRTDNVLTTSSRINEENNSFYTVTLKTLQGVPLSKTTVRYQVIDGDKVLDKGSERTDESGLLKIKVDNKNRGQDIILSFTSTDKRSVSKVIHTNVFESENHVDILPEGGHLLAGHLNNIAFKALKPNGEGIKATIDILDKQQNTVGSSETNELGMGAISFFPSADETYTLNVRFADGTTKTADIPEIKRSGMSLIINNQNNSKLYAQVSVSEDLLTGKELFFVVHHLGQVHYVSKQKTDKTNMVFSVAKENLPTGVLTISILDEALSPVFERPVFHNNPSMSLPLQVDLDKDSYGTREKVNASLHISDTQDTLNLSSFSAAVVNKTKLYDSVATSTNILSALLLGADIRGYIESPGYYFNPDGTIKMMEMDYLLLTQGWRKFAWDKLALVDIPKKFEAEKGLSIKGYTRKLGRKSASPNAAVQLISADNFMDFLDTTATEDGYFIFEDLLYPDSAKFLISAKDEKGKNNIDIVIEENIEPDVTKLHGGANDLNTLYQKEILASRRFFNELEGKGLMPNTIEIEEVVVSRERKKAPEHSRNLNGPGNADQLITWEDLETCPTLEMCLNGRLMGVIFQGGIPMNTRGMAPMQVILDGMYVEPDMLSTIPPQDVASVEVLRNINYTAIYGSYGGNGVLVITTKIGSEGRTNYTPKGLLSLQPKGISTAKEFYKPIYEIDSEQAFVNDLRTTIHWEPLLATDQDGKTSFVFYTADESGTYQMVIEGIDINGRIARKVVEFEVK